ncbi:threonine synthase [Halomicroarcula sp. GCM10025324]|uniref:threonine synthase n=1 Tax=Haloarcula TaxID=2237 RepID=UPI0023E7C57F|nr:threonine synthase [Halomicroarcula sp. ZS-22-S1]
MAFRCQACGTVVTDVRATCDRCGGFVCYTASDERDLERAIDGDPTAALPSFETSLSMGEGETPLVPLTHLDVGPTVSAKLESLNPTCSFKDRGSSLAVAAVADPETSWESIVVASTGNTAPSVAAYAARADIPCAVLVPDGTSLSKLTQVAAHGVEIYTLDGTFSDCFQAAQQISDDLILNATAVYSANPFVASANRTVAFELVEQLESVPDWVTVPVGAGPLLGGAHRGFVELFEAGLIPSVPKMLCVQARGCHPITRAIKRDEAVRPWIGEITTEIGAIADPLQGYPEDGERTRRSVVESDGDAVALDDETVHEWTARLAGREGIYAEPASAASVAAAATAPVADDETVVALVTGHGLKESVDSTLETTKLDDFASLRSALLG